MKVKTVIVVDVDLEDVFNHCVAISRRKCLKAIREQVNFLIDMRATDIDGQWHYPTADGLAYYLIEQGLVTAKDNEGAI